jgi:ABC-type transport system involved in cytochrome c biogenesis permease component
MRGPHVRALARATLLEAARRGDGWVGAIFLAGLAALMAGGRAAAGGDPASEALLLNLGLTLAAVLAQVATVLVASRQFPDELENRTLVPLLARPVDRGDVVLGKWAASAGMGVALYGAWAGAVLALSPGGEGYDPATGAQMAAFQVLALMAVAAWALALSLAMPRGVAVLAVLALAFGAGPFMRMASPLFPVAWLPDFGRLNLALRYTDGVGPMSAGDAAALAAAALLWTGLGLAAAVHGLERRRI